MQRSNHLKKYRSIEVNYLILMLLFFSIFIFTNIIRIIVGNKISLDLTIPFFSVLLYFLYFILNYKKIKFNFFCICVFILLLNIISLVTYKVTLSEETVFMVTIFSPLIIFVMEPPSGEIIKKTFLKIRFILNFVVVINTIYGVMDYMLKGALQLYLSNYLQNSSFIILIPLELSLKVYRLYSLLGHPLTNTFYYLAVFIVNLTHGYYFYDRHVRFSIIYIFIIIGMLLSNSKIGIVLLFIVLISIMLKFRNKNKYIYAVLFLIGVLIFSKSSYFENNVIPRFSEAIQMGDITNGRQTSLNILLNSNVEKPSIFLGKGFGSSVRLCVDTLGLTNSFENPIIMFSYDYGIVSTLLIYFIIFIYPSYIMIRNKHYYPFFLYLILFIFGNTYNGFGENLGVFQMFTYTAFILMSVSKYQRAIMYKQK